VSALINAQARREAKEKGFCTRCLAHRAIPGYSLCFECREYVRVYARRYTTEKRRKELLKQANEVADKEGMEVLTPQERKLKRMASGQYYQNIKCVRCGSKDFRVSQRAVYCNICEPYGRRKRDSKLKGFWPKRIKVQRNKANRSITIGLSIGCSPLEKAHWVKAEIKGNSIVLTNGEPITSVKIPPAVPTKDELEQQRETEMDREDARV